MNAIAQSVPLADDDQVVAASNVNRSKFATVLFATVVGVLLGNYLYERRRVTACLVETEGDVTTITPRYGG